MKRREFFKVVTKGAVGLTLALIGCKPEPEPKTVVDGGDQGGYLIPKEYTDQIWASIRGERNVFRRTSTRKVSWTTVDNPIGVSGITPGMAQPLGSSEFSEYLKGIGQ